MLLGSLVLLSAEKPSFFIENDRGVIFVTKQGNFTAITRIMKTLANSHHKFYYVAYCFCHSRRFNLREKQNNVFVVGMFIGRLKRVVLFLLKPFLRLQIQELWLPLFSSSSPQW